MGNQEINSEEFADHNIYQPGTPDFSKSTPKKKTSPAPQKSHVPHLSPTQQSHPSFIIKNTLNSASMHSEAKWCRTRVVLLQQTHGSRTILYDSKKSFMKSYPGAHDKKVLGDLVFGSAPFLRSTMKENRKKTDSSHIRMISTKVHYLSYFRQTVVSKLFHLRIPKAQLAEVLFPTYDGTSSSDSSSSSFSDSDDSDFGGHSVLSSNFGDCSCFECKPLFALVVIFSMFVPNQGSRRATAATSSNRVRVDSRSKKAGKTKGSPSVGVPRIARQIRGRSIGERVDSQQEMMNEKRKMIELQAFLFCSLSILMNLVEELQVEVCKSLRKTIVKVMKKWKKKKKKSVNDLISSSSELNRKRKKSGEGPMDDESEDVQKIYELNLKLSEFILDHDPPFLLHCKHFEQYVLTYLHSQKSAKIESGRDGGRMIPGGHGFFSKGGGLWQKVLMSGTGTSPLGRLPRTTWKNEGIGFGDPVLSMHRTSSSLKSVWTQLEEDILKLIHYISKRKLLHMGWTKDQGRDRASSKKKGKGSGRDTLQQPLERRVVHLTKRFLCSVLTAVFSHHTGWIFPFVRDGDRIGVDDQLQSVYGGCGSKRSGKKFCKILVVGNDYKIVRQLLVVLSFFVRSNPYVMKQYSINPTNQSLAHVGRSPSFDRTKKQPVDPRKKSVGRKKGGKKMKPRKEEVKKFIEEDEDDSSGDSEMVLKLYEILPMERFLDQQLKKKKKKPVGGDQGDGDNSFLGYTPLVSKKMYFSHHLSIPFGESLVFSEILPKFCPVYVLSAIPKNVDYFEGTIEGLRWDLEKSSDVDSSCCIVVDMNDLMCNVVMAKRSKSGIESSKKRISIDFHESLCSSFVLELFNQVLEIFHWGKELKSGHLLLNNFFNQKLKEEIVLAQLIIDWIEKEKFLFEKSMRKKKEGEEIQVFEIDEKRVCRELNIPSNDFCVLNNIVGYLRPDILKCIKTNTKNNRN